MPRQSVGKCNGMKSVTILCSSCVVINWINNFECFFFSVVHTLPPVGWNLKRWTRIEFKVISKDTARQPKSLVVFQCFFSLGLSLSLFLMNHQHQLGHCVISGLIGSWGLNWRWLFFKNSKSLNFQALSDRRPKLWLSFELTFARCHWAESGWAVDVVALFGDMEFIDHSNSERFAK